MHLHIPTNYLCIHIHITSTDASKEGFYWRWWWLDLLSKLWSVETSYYNLYFNTFFFPLMGDIRREVCTFILFIFFFCEDGSDEFVGLLNLSVSTCCSHPACSFNDERDAPAFGQSRWLEESKEKKIHTHTKKKNAVPPWDVVRRLLRLFVCVWESVIRYLDLVSVFTKTHLCSYIRVKLYKLYKYVNKQGLIELIGTTRCYTELPTF